MIGIWHRHTSEFLHVLAVLVLVLFALPISVAPLRWARVFRWTVDANSHLALYFGRCLGAVALSLVWACWYAGSHAALQTYFLDIFIGLAAMLTLVHVAGAVQRVQPWTENAEIGFWGLLVVVALMFYPVG